MICSFFSCYPISTLEPFVWCGDNILGSRSLLNLLIKCQCLTGLWLCSSYIFIGWKSILFSLSHSPFPDLCIPSAFPGHPGPCWLCFSLLGKIRRLGVGWECWEWPSPSWDKAQTKNFPLGHKSSGLCYRKKLGAISLGFLFPYSLLLRASRGSSSHLHDILAK